MCAQRAITVRLPLPTRADALHVTQDTPRLAPDRRRLARAACALRHFADMQFISTKVLTSKSANEGVITGKLTLHGVTKEMTFPFKVLGYANDPWGGYRTGIEAHANLKASDFGFTWGKAGSPVGDEIEVTLLIEGIKTN